MDALERTLQLGERRTRRSVVKSGAKLAYAVPVVAATFKLGSNGALAATCPEGSTQLDLDPGCCKCRGSVLVTAPIPVVVGGTAVCHYVDHDAPAECRGLTQSIP